MDLVELFCKVDNFCQSVEEDSSPEPLFTTYTLPLIRRDPHYFLPTTDQRYLLFGSDRETMQQQFTSFFSPLTEIAPGTSALVQEVFALHPQKIEQHFGITRGQIHHVDNSFGFADRLPYATLIQELYTASAACHPAGSVIGSAGYNAAMRVIKDMA